MKSLKKLERNIYYIERVMDLKNKLSAQDLFLNNNLSIVTVQDKYNNIFNWISIFDFNILIVIILMIVVAIISIIISMLTLIFERIKMIGIMSSLFLLKFFWRLNNKTLDHQPQHLLDKQLLQRP